MTLEIYTPQLSNCFLLNDSWDICTTTFTLLPSNESWEICTATFKLLPPKWLLRYVHRNFQTASFSMTLEKYAPQLSHCFLLNDSWNICTPQLSNCFLVNDSWGICTPQTFTLLPINDSWEICTKTFTLLPCKWLLRNMHRNFKTASF